MAEVENGNSSSLGRILKYPLKNKQKLYTECYGYYKVLNAVFSPILNGGKGVVECVYERK